MDIKKNIIKVKFNLPENITLVAVSKTKPASDIEIAYKSGQRVFGENKVQELQEKHPILPKDIQWHMIGHLQTNKVKYIAPFVSLIHAVDSLKLLKEINKQAIKNNRTIAVLLQFHIAKEESKFGLSINKAIDLITSEAFQNLKNVSVQGVMGMATFTENENQIKTEFNKLKLVFDKLKTDYFKDPNQFKEISMGMSGDYELAIQEGSTMVRIGSTIFGSRKI
jgi:pyridoxal phosphate enzyme (YggS family)|tara:strand:+ start:529 stop:1197 length:669 start_codon:yes stop_codon:yes gene_type:complete